jgi:hypothetical protein
MSDLTTAIACAGCGKPSSEVRLDLDVRATPPELVCPKCKRKPKCPRCGHRRNRLQCVPRGAAICLPCLKPRRSIRELYTIGDGGSRTPVGGTEHHPRCDGTWSLGKSAGRCALVTGHDGAHSVFGAPGTAVVRDRVIVVPEDS